MMSSLLLAVTVSAADAPKVLLVGDSIRMGYAPIVTKKLDGQAAVISPKENGGDTANVLKKIDLWLSDKPALVVLNCGLHDLKFKDGKHQVPPDQYEKNLKEIVGKIRKAGAKVVFASTTPIHDQRHKGRKLAFERTEAYVAKYNTIALKVMKAEGVPVLDLHEVVKANGTDQLLAKDGTHYTAAGYERLAAAVATEVRKQFGWK